MGVLVSPGPSHPGGGCSNGSAGEKGRGAPELPDGPGPGALRRDQNTASVTWIHRASHKEVQLEQHQVGLLCPPLPPSFAPPPPPPPLAPTQPSTHLDPSSSELPVSEHLHRGHEALGEALRKDTRQRRRGFLLRFSSFTPRLLLPFLLCIRRPITRRSSGGSGHVAPRTARAAPEADGAGPCPDAVMPDDVSSHTGSMSHGHSLSEGSKGRLYEGLSRFHRRSTGMTTSPGHPASQRGRACELMRLGEGHGSSRSGPQCARWTTSSRAALAS